MNNLDEQLDALLRDDTAVGPRVLPAGTRRRVARRHASLVAVTCAGILAGVSVVVAILGPLTGGSSAAPSVSPAATGVQAPAGYVQPAGWPDLSFGGSSGRVAALLADVQQGAGVSDATVIATGAVGNETFGVVTYHGDDQGTDLGTCAMVVVASRNGPEDQETPGCTQGWGVAVPGDRDILAATNFVINPTYPFETFSAIVSHHVAAVRVTMDDGTVATFPTIPGPAGSPVDVAVVFAPFGVAGHVEALAADGTVIDQATVCVPAEIRSGPPYVSGDPTGSATVGCSGNAPRP